ncbi:hypothetical protein DY000_02020376 [Brassica cretica]|uniref:Uncharacterized protein n=1 Tax=Brassica cretica TaxID=69181 RepID=A0ABQ7EKA9_BRACR|nr:hypothetical protein DY000_02020376 [Brassica cretica]
MCLQRITKKSTIQCKSGGDDNVERTVPESIHRKHSYEGSFTGCKKRETLGKVAMQ